MNITGVKFEEHCSYISRDILYLVFYNFSCTPYDVITLLICIIERVNISKTKKDIPKSQKSLSNKLQLFFMS